MRQTLLVLLACLPTLAQGAAQPLEGRWQGRVEIPGRELPVVVDLAPVDKGGWIGSIVIPGLGIKGAPAGNLVVTHDSVTFDLGNLLASPTEGPASFKARLLTTDRMSGEMRQAGNVAPLELARQGPAQVDLPPRSTPVAREIATQWSGEFELGGYPRQVTLTLENHGGDGAQAKLVIIGKRTNDIPVDLVIQQGTLLRIESLAMQVVFEGRIKADAREIGGVMELGPYELPLVLKREGSGS